MIYGILGNLGYGKTLSMVYLMNIMKEKNHPIYSNIEMFDFDYNYIDDFYKLFPIEDGYIFYDEIDFDLNARDFHKDENKDSKDFLKRIRKNRVHFFWSCQFLHLVELHIREFTFYWLRPFIYNDVCRILVYTYNGELIDQKKFKASDYFRFYDHEEKRHIDKRKRSKHFKDIYENLLDDVKKDEGVFRYNTVKAKKDYLKDTFRISESKAIRIIEDLRNY